MSYSSDHPVRSSVIFFHSWRVGRLTPGIPTGSFFFCFLTKRALPSGWMFWFGCRIDLPDTTNSSPPRIAASDGLLPLHYSPWEGNPLEIHAHVSTSMGISEAVRTLSDGARQSFPASRKGIRTGGGADEQEEKRDLAERVSPKPRRKGRWRGPPRLKGSSPPFGTIWIIKGNLASRQVPFFRFFGPSG